MTAIAPYGYHRETNRVVKVQFGIFSPERILQHSVAEIFRVNPDEKIGTLRDPRMGSPTLGSLNPLTGLLSEDDPGHFGHLVLAKPCINIVFWDTIVKILNATCYQCANILAIDPKKPKTAEDLQAVAMASRLDTILKKRSTKAIRCPHCGAIQPSKFIQVKSGGSLINAVWDNFEEIGESTPGGRRFSAEQILDIFSRFSDYTVRLLGFNPTLNHPAWMIWTIFPIPPPSIRPSITLEGVKGNSEDDLTLILTQIISLNAKLRNRISDLENQRQSQAQKIEQINDTWITLEHACAAFIDNENDAINKMTNNSQRPYRGIKQRIQPPGRNKDSIIRAHLMGKRVNWSARSVITGAAYLSMGQLGVPQAICETLYYPEVVNQYNRFKLQALVQRGTKYPGARAVIRFIKKGNITYKRQQTLTAAQPYIEQLRDGDVVLRHLIKGDLVIFNRQPTLHKMSMMVHEVVPVKGLSFTLPVIDTSPYGADFDGDEMNMHMLLSQMSLAEGQLMKVQRLIISPQNSAPVIGLKEDTQTGFYRLTSSLPKDFRFNLPQFYQMVGLMINYNGTLTHPDNIPQTAPIEQVGYSPQDVVSQMLPPITIMLKKEKDLEDRDLVIKNGILKSGKFDKTLIANKARGGLPHLVWKDLGSLAARSMLDDFSRVVSHWLHIYEGFSVSIADFALSLANRQKLVARIQDGVKKVKDLIESFRQGTSQIKMSHLVSSLDEQLEQEIQLLLAQITTDGTDEAAKILRGDPLNRAFNMIDSGSKGNTENLMEISTALGFKTLSGRQFQDYLLRRVLPHFPKDDASPEQRGFIQNSFLEGLAPHEFALFAAIGRESGISTSIMTAQTGYISRQLMKNQESVKVEYDYTVTSAGGHIIQYTYGGDSCDGAYLENVRIPHMGLSNEIFELRYRHLLPPPHVAAHGEPYSTPKMDQEYEQLLRDREWLNSTATRLGKKFTRLMLPVNWQRLIDNATINFGLNRERTTTLTPDQIIEQVTTFIRSLQISQYEPVNQSAIQFFSVYTRACLASKPLLEEYRFTPEAFTFLLNQGQSTFDQSLIAPGECVGPLTAQSIGEPTTQLTLSTHHAAGSAAKRGTQGVPRANEIISVTQHPKTPVTDIYLRPDPINPPPERLANQTDQEWLKQIEDWRVTQIERANRIINQIQLQTIGKLINNLEIIYDPNPLHLSIIEEDRPFLQAYAQIEKSFHKTATAPTSPWVLRMQFDRELMVKNQVTMYDIELKLLEALEIYNQARFITQFSDENSKKLVGRVNLRASPTEQIVDPIKILRELNDYISEIPIRGIKGVKQGQHRDNKGLTYVAPSNGELRSLGHPRYNNCCLNQETVIEMAGTNLPAIMAIPEVDPTRCRSNDFWEIYRLFGIEATRQLIIDEFSLVIDKYVVNRHINLLADQMTNSGIPISITRTGLRKSQLSILDRMSYETAMAQAITAATRAVSDPVNSVTARIMTGSLINGGTGFFEVCLDEELINQLPQPPKTNYRQSQNLNPQEIAKRIAPNDVQKLFSRESMEFTFQY